MNGKRTPPETQEHRICETQRAGDAPVWRTCAGRKTQGGQVNFRMSEAGMTLLAAALDRYDVDQTTLMTTAFLEFCERYGVKS